MPSLWDLMGLITTVNNVAKTIAEECDIKIMFNKKAKTITVTAYKKGTDKIVFNLVVQTSIDQLLILLESLINAIHDLYSDNKA